MSQNKQEPEFLEYVNQLNEGRSLSEAFDHSQSEIESLDLNQLERIGLNTYAEGKWTIHQIIQHLIDWERIWCFRAILFAREEGTIPVAHDQESMAANSNANKRTISDLINELRLVRQSTIMLFNSFESEDLKKSCAFFEYEMPLDALAFTITAHQIHHWNVINERYINLV